MFHFDYLTERTCSKLISLDLADDGTVHNISFMGGCDGNLKALPILLEGWTPDQLRDTLGGVTCGRRGTSCAAQLALAAQAAVEASQDPNWVSPLEEDD